MMRDPIPKTPNMLDVLVHGGAGLFDCQVLVVSGKRRHKMGSPQAYILPFDKEILPKGEFEFRDNFSRCWKASSQSLHIISGLVALAAPQAWQGVIKTAIEVPCLPELFFKGFNRTVTNGKLTKLEGQKEGG